MSRIDSLRFVKLGDVSLNEITLFLKSELFFESRLFLLHVELFQQVCALFTVRICYSLVDILQTLVFVSWKSWSGVDICKGPCGLLYDTAVFKAKTDYFCDRRLQSQVVCCRQRDRIRFRRTLRELQMRTLDKEFAIGLVWLWSSWTESYRAVS